MKRLQTALKKSGFLGGSVDGIFGHQTADGVLAFQGSIALPQSGNVDANTWTSLLKTPVPTVDDRSLQVTAAFEGHGFGLAQGNFDGAGITWGVIGFTLQGGEIAKIVRVVQTVDPTILPQSFGPETSEFLAILERPWPDQLAWADSLSEGPGKAILAQPWRSHFAIFGDSPEVQNAQLARVAEDYMQPANLTASTFGLRTELGHALAFDIRVQNGGIKSAARAQIEAAVTIAPPSTEQDLRVVIANAVADNAKQKFQVNVRARKLALATGHGTVNGLDVVLANWGIDESLVDS